MSARSASIEGTQRSRALLSALTMSNACVWVYALLAAAPGH